MSMRERERDTSWECRCINNSVRILLAHYMIDEIKKINIINGYYEVNV